MAGCLSRGAPRHGRDNADLRKVNLVLDHERQQRVNDKEDMLLERLEEDGEGNGASDALSRELQPPCMCGAGGVLNQFSAARRRGLRTSEAQGGRPAARWPRLRPRYAGLRQAMLRRVRRPSLVRHAWALDANARRCPTDTRAGAG